MRDAPGLLQRVEGVTGDELRAQTLMRREFPAELVRAAFALRALRRKAQGRFTRAAEMWFDRQGLEQATCEALARHKARRFKGDVWDLCCGLGGDALALAARCSVTAVDLHPTACLLARWNLEVYGVQANARILQQPCEELALDERALVHVDPDRRAQSGRAARIENYTPGPQYFRTLMNVCHGGGIKLSPAANFLGRFPDAEIEVVSLNGECKEATVWFGELAGAKPYRATVLPSGETIEGHPLEAAAPRAVPEGYVFEPDPAVVRSGLVDHAACQLGLARLDSEEEYLTGSRPVQSSLVKGFELLAVLPYREVDLKRYFRQSRFGRVEIKCRRIPCQIEQLRRQVPLPGDEPAVLILARCAGTATALICRRLESR